MDVCDVCGIRNNGPQHVKNGHSASLACQEVFRAFVIALGLLYSSLLYLFRCTGVKCFLFRLLAEYYLTMNKCFSIEQRVPQTDLLHHQMRNLNSQVMEGRVVNHLWITVRNLQVSAS